MSTTITTRRGVRLAAGMAALALTATACGGDDGSDTAASSGGSDCETVTFGFIPSWTDGLSNAWLWKDVLEERGYEVQFREISEAAPLYAGLSQGDIDVYPSAVPEVTHADYMAEYGEDIEDLGVWYRSQVLTLAVPEYTDIDSIADLTADADRFGGRIVGIEPGAGLTRITKESVMPAYGLGEAGFELVESSTVAMLAELQSAVDAQEDVVVTLWHPFWAYSQFQLKDLDDPEGAFGEPEAMHVLGREGFSTDCAEVADLMGEHFLTGEQYASLENMVVNEYGEGRYAEAVEAWFEVNPDVEEALKG